MKLPSNAIISEEKIKDYLLSKKKRNDKSKWLSRAGYNLNNWQKLEIDLRNQILCLDAVLSEKTKYGGIFEIKDFLKGPNRKTLKVHTVWITEYESGFTKFITMFPDKK